VIPHEIIEDESPQGTVTASLEELTMMGKLTIKFSTSVDIENMGTLGSTLEVEILDREGKEISNATLSVETLELEGAYLYCLVKFANPKHISTYETDKLRLRFLNSHRVS